MDGITHIYCKRFNYTGITVLVDVIYSPDDGGYYLEKSQFKHTDDSMIEWYAKDIYPTEFEAKNAFKSGQVRWERR